MKRWSLVVAILTLNALAKLGSWLLRRCGRLSNRLELELERHERPR